jgi:hypothetical protein
MRLAIPSDQRIAGWLGLRLSESTVLLPAVLSRALLVGAEHRILKAFAKTQRSPRIRDSDRPATSVQAST